MSKPDPMIIPFIERALRHHKGEWAGKGFKLQGWQKEILREVFGNVDKHGNRVIRQVYLEVPRKSGKTTLASAIALWLLIEGEPGAEIYSAAASREQAHICFDSAKNMVEGCPALKNKLEPYKQTIIYPQTKSIYKSISADAYTAHGANAHGIIIDELHTQKSRDLYDTLLTSTLSRRQPLVVMITTAGSDRTSFCHEMHTYAQRWMDGTIKNKAFYAKIYAADLDDDWTQEETWRKANPGYGITVKPEYFFQQVQECKDNPAKEASFRRDHLNQWVETDVRWISPLKWDECQVPMPDLIGRECYAGLDLSATMDLTALTLFFPSTYEDEPHFMLPIFWAPSEANKLREKLNRQRIGPWVKQGFINETEGNRIDYRQIKRGIMELGEKYKILEIAFDPWHADQIVHELSDHFEMVKFGQTPVNLSPPTKKLEEFILTKQVAHAGNPVLRWNLGNIACSLDDNNNYKLSKKKSRDKIDGIIAGVMAVGRWMVTAQNESTENPTGAGIEFL
jgi:phage terminase large subunit-like protein